MGPVDYQVTLGGGFPAIQGAPEALTLVPKPELGNQGNGIRQNKGDYVPQSILTHIYDNGLALVAEPMDWLQSAAFSILLPAGSCSDPEDRPGLADFTGEMIQRGCGPRDSRQFVADLERLGVDHSASAATLHVSYGGAMLADNLTSAMTIFADLVRRPHLPEDQIEEGRLVCLQELYALEDDLAQKTMVELVRRLYPDPWGRPHQGTIESVEQISIDDVRRHYERTYRPDGAILSVAGNFDWQHVKDHVGTLLDDWQSAPTEPVAEKPAAGGYHHIAHDSSQTQIAVAYPGLAYRDPDYFQLRGAVGVLSGGMSSRLFTEVREKRGLCYTVYAVCHSLRHTGSVLCYAGTSTDRAQETLDVMLAEIGRLHEGIEQGELNRLKTRIKSMLIMQQESSPARSGSIAADWFHLARVRTLDELGRIVDGLTCQSINAYLESHPPEDFTIVTLGEKELEVHVGVSSPNA